jgi:hypothetical protein
VFKDLFVENEKTRDVAEKYQIQLGDISGIRKRVLEKCRSLLE